MDPIIPQQPEPQYQAPMDSVVSPQVPDHKYFLNKKFIVTFVILLLLGTGAYAGIWYWQNQQVAQEAVPTFTPRADETADWKTYTNTQYGFEVRDPYPVGSSKIVDNKFEVRFATPPGETRAIITIERSNQTAQQWYESFTKTPDFPVAQHIIISGEPAIRIDTNEWGLSLVGVQHGGYFFLFDGNMIEPLLSTFKFTDSSASFCGGIAGVRCPASYICKLEGTYPDAGGTCVKEGAICAQVITRAKNLTTGEIRDFPTPCDVPSGWQKI